MTERPVQSVGEQPASRADNVTSAAAPTGDARVEAAVAELDQLDRLDPGEHPAVYSDIHRALSAVLGDAGSPAPAGVPPVDAPG